MMAPGNKSIRESSDFSDSDTTLCYRSTVTAIPIIMHWLGITVIQVSFFLLPSVGITTSDSTTGLAVAATAQGVCPVLAGSSEIPSGTYA